MFYRLLLLWAFAGLFACRQDAAPRPQSATAPGSPHAESPRPRPAADVPAHVLETLRYIRTHDRAPDGYVGGRTFQNREKRLPERGPDGAALRYREWDVHPKVPGKNRGAERLVTGSDRSAYYTKDHYRSFTKIE